MYEATEGKTVNACIALDAVVERTFLVSVITFDMTASG